MTDSQDAIGLLRSLIAHRAYIQAALGRVQAALAERADVHDLSKLQDDEFEGFSRINAAARVQKFGSPEYAEGMKREKPTIDLHFSRNSHHAEFVRGGEALSFLDIIEMVCDWWAARKGYGDSRSWADTVKLNMEQKGPKLSEWQRFLAYEVADFLAKRESDAR